MVIGVLWSYRPVKTTDIKEQRICIKLSFKFSTMALETYKMLKEAFPDNALGQTHTYRGFKRFKNKKTVSRRWQAFWTNCDWNHDRKCGKSAKGSPARPKTDDSQYLQQCWTVIWKVPEQLFGWAQHVVHCIKICTKADEQTSKGIMHCYSNQAKGTERKQPKLHLQHHYSWQSLGIWVQTL